MKTPAVLSVTAVLFVVAATSSAFAHHVVQFLNPQPRPQTEPVSHKFPFPDNVDLSTVSITLSRTACLGTCASYTVTISGTGKVVFVGYPPYVELPGRHITYIPPAEVQTLLQHFKDANFLSAEDEYSTSVTDVPNYELTLSIGSIQKKVFDRWGAESGMPASITALENDVDKTASTLRWIKFGSDTGDSLAAAHWNFSAITRENTLLYNKAIERNNQELLAYFLQARGSVIFLLPGIPAPICLATERADLNLVQRMLPSLPWRHPLSADLLASCITAAAHSGNLALLNLWLNQANVVPAPAAQQAQVRPPDTTHPYFPAMAEAIKSGNPDVVARLLKLHPNLHPTASDPLSLLNLALLYGDGKLAHRLSIVRLLLDAGADPNEAGANGFPPIFEIDNAAEVIPLLTRAGANPNVRAANGVTPLMLIFTPAGVKGLLLAGADPTLRDDNGKTTLDRNQYHSCTECVTLLRDAVAKREGLSPSISR